MWCIELAIASIPRCPSNQETFKPLCRQTCDEFARTTIESFYNSTQCPGDPFSYNRSRGATELRDHCYKPNFSGQPGACISGDQIEGRTCGYLHPSKLCNPELCPSSVQICKDQYQKETDTPPMSDYEGSTTNLKESNRSKSQSQFILMMVFGGIGGVLVIVVIICACKRLYGKSIQRYEIECVPEKAGRAEKENDVLDPYLRSKSLPSVMTNFTKGIPSPLPTALREQHISRINTGNIPVDNNGTNFGVKYMEGTGGPLLKPDNLDKRTSSLITDQNTIENGPLYKESNDLELVEFQSPKQFIAMRMYSPCLEDEMELEPGDIISVSQVWDDGWALGLNLSSGQVGVLPMSFVRHVSVQLTDLRTVPARESLHANLGNLERLKNRSISNPSHRSQGDSQSLVEYHVVDHSRVSISNNVQLLRETIFHDDEDFEWIQDDRGDQRSKKYFERNLRYSGNQFRDFDDSFHKSPTGIQESIECSPSSSSRQLEISEVMQALSRIALSERESRIYDGWSAPANGIIDRTPNLAAKVPNLHHD
jgi:hypothetical protein